MPRRRDRSITQDNGGHLRRGRIVSMQKSAGPITPQDARVTEDGDNRITEDGDARWTE